MSNEFEFNVKVKVDGTVSDATKQDIAEEIADSVDDVLANSDRCKGTNLDIDSINVDVSDGGSTQASRR